MPFGSGHQIHRRTTTVLVLEVSAPRGRKGKFPQSSIHQLLAFDGGIVDEGSHKHVADETIVAAFREQFLNEFFSRFTARAIAIAIAVAADGGVNGGGGDAATSAGLCMILDLCLLY